MEIHRLGQRATVLRGIREFFYARRFLEVETPVVLPYPSQELYLEPLRTVVRDHCGKTYNGFLRMSPEFSLKKLTARMCGHCEELRDEAIPAGIFEIGPVFRDGEPWGGSHNLEFTMLEWYRLGATYVDLMRDCEELVLHLIRTFTRGERRGSSKFKVQSSKQIQKSNVQISYQRQIINCAFPWERLTMREAWRRYAHLDLNQFLTRTAMARACCARGYTVTRCDTFDDLFFKIHLSEVEPKIGRARPTFLLDWPAQMAALARRKPRDPRYAERVELYIGGLEVANGFSELMDADEQLARFRDDQRLRRRIGKPVYPIDPDFIAALRHLPPCAGMALGVDRLVMLLTDAASINEARWLPAFELFTQQSGKRPLTLDN